MAAAFNKLSLAGKVAIITGSSSGIGRGAAMLFCQRGGKVTLHGRNLERLRAAHDEIVKAGISADNILMVDGDITDATVRDKLVSATLEKFGKIDCLVNNAGSVAGDKELLKLEEEDMTKIFKLLLFSPVLLSKLCHPHLKETKGCIVNISSIGAEMSAMGAWTYGAAKAGLDKFTKNASTEWSGDGIRINSIRPGCVVTNLFSAASYPPEFVDVLLQTTPKTTPVGINAEPSDIAEAICYLASEASRYATGSTITLDGGISVPVLFKDTLEMIQKMSA